LKGSSFFPLTAEKYLKKKWIGFLEIFNFLKIKESLAKKLHHNYK